ncbi:10230_t:CDS:2 [Paraglomus occultum]|uniref:10230_t:CDS:1 n=1 Tax=Paraglomus occultum TaxID=144539 RepID=A0A9N9FT93_9GLOM|nr:10230_t:CDS:2 [Paraglomus occultum]
MAAEETAVTTETATTTVVVEAAATEVTTTAVVQETETVQETAVTDSEPVKLEEENENKVFVGNLSFQTTEPELAEFFGKFGKVVKANIITRGTRSLGYGFVALETKEDAEKVIAELNREELGGRSINVEAAKPKTDTGNPPAFHSSRRGRGRYHLRGRGGRGRGRGSRGRGRGRGGWQGRRRFSGRNEDSAAVPSNDTAADAPNTNGAHADESGTHKSNRGYRSRRPRGRGGRGRGRFSRRRPANSNYAAGAAKTGDPSKTIVFVANLPFSVNDDGLKEIFKDYQVKSAHVVRRRGGRSKGFGFVELIDENEQTRALEGLKNVQSEGRELVIKVALSDQQAHMDEEKAGGQEGGEVSASAANPPANEEPNNEESVTA